MAPPSSTAPDSNNTPIARPYSRDVLRAGGRRSPDSYVFFHSHRPSRGDYAVLSNWYELPTPFADGQGRQYPTSEHYMMYQKAVLFGDAEMGDAILAATTPFEAKMLGRKVRHFSDSTWHQNALRIVTDGWVLKFDHCVHARSILLGTAGKILVEAAPRDTIWGIGMGARNAHRLDPNTWRGQNLLGEALMTARDRLRGRTVGNTADCGAQEN